MSKKLMAILKYRIQRAVMYEKTEGQRGVDIEIKRAYDDIMELLPKKRKIPEGLEHLDKYDEDRGWNLAIDQFQKNMEG